MAQMIDMKGDRYGRLTVVGLVRIERRKSGSGGTVPIWKCRCDCGKEVERTRSHLRRPGTMSCGCWKAEVAKEMGQTLKRQYEIARCKEAQT